MCLKRFLALISAAIMLMSLASCTLDPADNSSRSDSSASSGEPSDADSSEPSESSDSSSEPDAPNGELSPVRLKKLDVFYAPKQASCVYTVDISGLFEITQQFTRREHNIQPADGSDICRVLQIAGSLIKRDKDDLLHSVPLRRG